MSASATLACHPIQTHDVLVCLVDAKDAPAEPLNRNTRNGTTTAATHLESALSFAEARYGPRDTGWSIPGVEFASVPTPQIYYRGARRITIQLTAEAETDVKRTLFQLGHEVIHTLSPIGPGRRTSVLEEGIATYNSLDFVRDAGIGISPDYIGAEAYEDAYSAIVELEVAQPDFVQRTGDLRARCGGLSGVNAPRIQAAYPAISTSFARRLASIFEAGTRRRANSLRRTARSG